MALGRSIGAVVERVGVAIANERERRGRKGKVGGGGYGDVGFKESKKLEGGPWFADFNSDSISCPP